MCFMCCCFMYVAPCGECLGVRFLGEQQTSLGTTTTTTAATTTTTDLYIISCVYIYIYIALTIRPYTVIMGMKNHRNHRHKGDPRLLFYIPKRAYCMNDHSTIDVLDLQKTSIVEWSTFVAGGITVKIRYPKARRLSTATMLPFTGDVPIKPPFIWVNLITTEPCSPEPWNHG